MHAQVCVPVLQIVVSGSWECGCNSWPHGCVDVTLTSLGGPGSLSSSTLGTQRREGSVGFWRALAGTEVLPSVFLKASLQAQVPYVQQQFQQVHERHTQQPQQHHTLLGNHTLQVHLQGQANVAMPLYEEPMTFMQTQPTVLPVQLVAGQQPSGYYQNETLRGTEGNSHR